MHCSSNRDIDLYLPHNNSSVHLTITKARFSGVSPIERGVVGQHYEAPYLHPQHRRPPPWNGPDTNSVDLSNRLCTGVGRFRFCIHKWGMAPSAVCECGGEEQTGDTVAYL